MSLLRDQEDNYQADRLDTHNTSGKRRVSAQTGHRVLSVFREVQFHLVVLDEAHLYVTNVLHTITPQTVVVRTHAYVYTTVLVTATPAVDRGSVL